MRPLYLAPRTDPDRVFSGSDHAYPVGVVAQLSGNWISAGIVNNLAIMYAVFWVI